jgi:hypothetical protein
MTRWSWSLSATSPGHCWTWSQPCWIRKMWNNARPITERKHCATYSIPIADYSRVSTGWIGPASCGRFPGYGLEPAVPFGATRRFASFTVGSPLRRRRRGSCAQARDPSPWRARWPIVAELAAVVRVPVTMIRRRPRRRPRRRSRRRRSRWIRSLLRRPPGLQSRCSCSWRNGAWMRSNSRTATAKTKCQARMAHRSITTTAPGPRPPVRRSHQPTVWCIRTRSRRADSRRAAQLAPRAGSARPPRS